MVRNITQRLFFLCFILSGCYSKNNSQNTQPIEVKLVLTAASSKVPGEASTRRDQYYVYNFREKDTTLLLNILDTLTIDTTYTFHSHIFYDYHTALPDTADLRKEMDDPYVFELKEEPGMGKFSQYRILDFTFQKHYAINGRGFPDSYSLTMGSRGKITERYFLRDSITGKLKEVNRTMIYP